MSGTLDEFCVTNVLARRRDTVGVGEGLAADHSSARRLE